MKVFSFEISTKPDGICSPENICHTFAMELNCDFVYQAWYAECVDKGTQLYTCQVTVAEIGKPGTVIRAFNGTHLAGKSHKDVEGLYFSGCTMKHFPRGIQNIFPRLRRLQVSNCGLTTIARSDFDGLQSLEALHIYGNPLKSLPSDLFVGMSKLKIIDFYSNQIESISSDILKPVMNNGLEEVSFGNNGSLHDFFRPGHPRSTASIAELMRIIDAKCTKLTDDKSTAPDQHDLTTKAKESVATAFSGLWESKELADFTITVGSKKFRVHKLILVTQSSKFAKMFKEHESNEMSITDLDEVVVEAFLRFFYTGNVPNDVNFIQLFGLSSKLDVAILTTYCEGEILSNLGESNAFKVFRLGHSYGNDELKKQAFGEICKMFPDVKMPDSLMNKPDELKLLIDKQQELNSLKARIEKM